MEIRPLCALYRKKKFKICINFYLCYKRALCVDFFQLFWCHIFSLGDLTCTFLKILFRKFSIWDEVEIIMKQIFWKNNFRKKTVENNCNLSSRTSNVCIQQEYIISLHSLLSRQWFSIEGMLCVWISWI